MKNSRMKFLLMLVVLIAVGAVAYYGVYSPNSIFCKLIDTSTQKSPSTAVITSVVDAASMTELTIAQNSTNTMPKATSTVTPKKKVTTAPTKKPVKKILPKPTLPPVKKIVQKPVVVVPPPEVVPAGIVRFVATSSAVVPARRIVVIDAGHGGKDPGAVAKVYENVAVVTPTPTNTVTPVKTNASGTVVIGNDTTSSPEPTATPATVAKTYYEKDLNLSMAIELNRLLKAQGIETYMIRTDDTYVPYGGIGKIAMDNSGVIFVSIHCNASGTNAEAKGVETYYYNDYWIGNLKTSQFASIMQKNIVAGTGFVDNKVRNDREFSVIVKTKNMLAVLCEMGYMSNTNDINFLISEDFRKKNAANALANGIIESFEKMGQ